MNSPNQSVEASVRPGKNPAVREVTAGYYAQRGYFTKELQSVFKKWKPILGEKKVVTLWATNRFVLETQRGRAMIDLQNMRLDDDKIRFFQELTDAYEQLFAPDNLNGWVLTLWNQLRKNPRVPRNSKTAQTLITVEELRQIIIDRTKKEFEPGYTVEIAAIRKCAKRLKLTVPIEESRRLDKEINNLLDFPIIQGA